MLHLFTRDSLTKGNGREIYAHYVKEMKSGICTIDAVSRTTVGRYSQYLVNKACLAAGINMIASAQIVSDAIVLESGRTTYTESEIAFVNALGEIRQLSPKRGGQYTYIVRKDKIKAA